MRRFLRVEFALLLATTAVIFAYGYVGGVVAQKPTQEPVDPSVKLPPGRSAKFGPPQHDGGAALRKAVAGGHRIIPVGMELGTRVSVQTNAGETAVRLLGQSQTNRHKEYAFGIRVTNRLTDKEVAARVYPDRRKSPKGELVAFEFGDFFDLPPGRYAIQIYIFDMNRPGRKNQTLTLSDPNVQMMTVFHEVG